MFLIMGVSLYTSRIVLKVLGISDFGIYSLVAGIVSMFGFFNAAMSSATQRYLSFDIGKGDITQLKRTFSAVTTIHIGISVLVLIIAETIGLWYINTKMVFPPERLFAVNAVYQFTILSFIVNIIHVPYNALIIARERMSIYAYVSIFDAILKLAAVFLLSYMGYDKLITYAFLTFCITLTMQLVYRIYCKKYFIESRYKFVYDKKYFKELIGYSGWNLFGNIAAVAKGQGANMILNLFYGTVINAAYGIAMQVQGAVNLFVSNFQVAVNPQIIQQYSQGNFEQSRKLIVYSSKLSFFLMLIIISPILANIDYILETWLEEVPQYTNIFVALCLVNILIDSLSGPLMTGIQATGRIKWYQIITGSLIFCNLPISYLALKYVKDITPDIIFEISILISIISFIIRLYFIKKALSFSIKQFIKGTICKIILVSILSFIYIYIISEYSEVNTLVEFFYHAIIYILGILLIIFSVGINKNERKMLVKLKQSLYK